MNIQRERVGEAESALRTSTDFDFVLPSLLKCFRQAADLVTGADEQIVAAIWVPASHRYSDPWHSGLEIRK